jgi:hypothetical protein
MSTNTASSSSRMTKDGGKDGGKDFGSLPVMRPLGIDASSMGTVGK